MITITFATGWARCSNSRASTVVRKFFHIVIIAVFVVGLQDVSLLSFVTSAMLLIFILLEVLRYSRLPPFADSIESCFQSFRDEKDSGFLTLTHIYLLIGCASSLWLLPVDKVTSLCALSGIISIGFGDTAASVVGSRFGRHKLRGSNKTYEGAFAAIIAQTVASIVFWQHLNPGLSLTNFEVIALLVISSIVSFIEATTNQVDNLILPLYHNIILLACKLLFVRL
jgi:dolichol kinase